MLRSTLLGLVTLGAIPVVLADATATTNRQIVREQPTNCIVEQRSSDCLTTVDADNLKINSQLWLTDIADVLLSGSMFQGCQIELESKLDAKIKNLQPSLKNLTTSGCIFAWQKPYEDWTDDRALSTIEQVDAKNNSANSYSSTRSEISRHKFPKLSRTSLIVSSPTDNGIFVSDSSKLANPAPETKRIASPFGWRKRPYSYQLQFHQGIDYGAPLGSPVVAVGDGIVTKVVSGCYDFGNLFCGGQLGNWIEVDHGNGRLGIYGHLKNSSIAVEEGMKVWKNQEIAQVGSSGWSTGAHLDFRLKVNGEYEDPAKHVMAID